MVARTAEAGSATKSVPLTVARPPSEVEDLLQILQSDLLEEGPPTCILSPEGEMVYANKAYHRLAGPRAERSEEHTSELQSLMRISYAVFCLKKKKKSKTKY